jgi:hypothetical protein
LGRQNGHAIYLTLFFLRGFCPSESGLSCHSSEIKSGERVVRVGKMKTSSGSTRTRHSSTRPRPRPRPYSWSEVIHKPGSKALFLAFERERPRIVNNFAASALSGYEFSSSSEKMNCSRLSNLAVVLESGKRILRLGRIVSETITSRYKEFASVSGRANDQ